MALLDAGAFPNTAFPSRGWMAGAFPRYGTYVPPSAPTVIDIGAPPRRVKKKRFVLSPEILTLIKQWLELE